jgi:SPP1 gp7 family putative phage head morphogenesis protein
VCVKCEIVNVGTVTILSEDDYDRIISSIYFGSINRRNLDLVTYLKTAGKLSDGVFKGYGISLSDSITIRKDYEMIKALTDNVYIFSAAKTYQQTKEVVKELTFEGNIVPFSEFKKKAREILSTYNERYLKAEYQAAVSQSKTASQWQQIEQLKGSGLGLLKYQTINDGQVRPEHAALDNIVRPVDDPFWGTFMPPNGWNCRCDVVQLEDKSERLTNISKLKVTEEMVPAEFRFNAGKEKIVFSPEHPYFTIEPRDKGFARNNFNLPMP